MNPSSPSPSRRSSIFALASLVAVGLSSLVLGSACDAGTSAPRALIVVDASDAARPAQAAWISARKIEFEKASGRSVRVLRIDGADAAIVLASRGEADVVLVPVDTAKDQIDRFFASDHGRELGVVSIAEGGLRVIAVNPKQHPKVDAAGESLAAFLLNPAAGARGGARGDATSKSAP